MSNYICQNITDQKEGIISGNYKTFMDKDCQIRGWKKYPVRKDGQQPDPQKPPIVHGRENLDVATTFRPLKEGTTFRGKIYVHNLRLVELGTLVWALTLGGNQKLRHSVGMAKPYGYGSIQIKILSSDMKDVSQKNIGIDQACQDFEKFMESQKPGWKGSAQIRELLNMSNPDFPHIMDITKYPYLGIGSRNEFVQNKKDNKALLSYSGTLISPSSLRNAFSHSNGETVECEVLEQKTKKGGWMFQIKGEGESGNGILQPSSISKTPADIAPGKIYKMKIHSYSKGNSSFQWI